jgi:hypothetical protein
MNELQPKLSLIAGNGRFLFLLPDAARPRHHQSNSAWYISLKSNALKILRKKYAIVEAVK